MAGTAYAINVYLTNGDSGFVKFKGDGTWDWRLVYDVNEATLYRSKDECLDDYYKHIRDSHMTTNSSVRIEKGYISECYCPWL